VTVPVTGPKNQPRRCRAASPLLPECRGSEQLFALVRRAPDGAKPRFAVAPPSEYLQLGKHARFKEFL